MEFNNRVTFSSQIWVVKHVIYILITFAFLFQMLFYYNNTSNLVSTLLITLSTIITCEVTLHPIRFFKFPLWCFGIFFFNLTTSSGALIIKSVERNMVIHNLQVPLLTFKMLFITSAILSFTLLYYANNVSKRGITRFLSNKFWGWGFIKWPSIKHIWILGMIGLCCSIFSTGSFMGEENISKFDKVLAGLRFIRYMPFLLLFPELSGNPSIKRKVKPVLIYFGILIIAGILKNSRGTFMDAFILVFLVFFVGLGIGIFRLTNIEITDYVKIVVFSIMLFLILSKLSGIMLEVRQYRDKITPKELLYITIDAISESNTEINKEENPAVNNRGYGEKYVKSSVVGRFILTKFNDNILFYMLDFTKEDYKQVLLFELFKIVNIIPSPILKIFNISTDKSLINFSMGDAIVFTAENWGLGGYKVGSTFSMYYSLLGIVYPLFVIFSALVVFWIPSLFVYHNDESILISPIILIYLWDLIVNGLNSGGFYVNIAFILRNIPQSMIIYFFLKYIINYFLKED